MPSEEQLLRQLYRDAPLEYAKSAYCRFIQALFFGLPEGAAYKWSDDLKATRIVIKDGNSVTGQEVNYRPGVTFSRGPVQSMNLGINDRLRYDASTGGVVKSVLLPGTMNINIISRVPQEAENLAWLITESLWLHRQLFLQMGFFDIGRSWVIGSPTPAGRLVEGDGGDEWYAVTVSSPFVIYRTSEVTPLGKQIAENLGIRLRTQSSDTGATYVLRPNPLDPSKTVVSRQVTQGQGVRSPDPTYPRVPIQGPPGPQGIPGPSGGTTLERTADVVLSAYKVVYATAGDGANYADHTQLLHRLGLLGITLHAASSGSLVQIIRSGELEEATWSWTPELPIYCGVGGMLTQVPPTTGWLGQVAYATSPTSIIVNLGPPVLLA